MVKHKRRSRRRRYLKGKIDHLLDIGTLAAQTLISSDIVDTLTDAAWMTSVKATYSLNSVTQTDNLGPLLVGIAHSDYSSAEIEEWIESTTSWETKDKVGQEVARRYIREVGIFNISGSTSAVNNYALNEGRPITTKCGWMLEGGQTVKFWAYNTGSAAFATTDPDVRVQGHANLWPK